MRTVRLDFHHGLPATAGAATVIFVPLVLLLATLLSAPPTLLMAAQQETPDFSGTWTLDTDRSDPPPQVGRRGGFGRRGGRGGGRGGGFRAALFNFDKPVVVTQTGTELRMENDDHTIVYLLDGSESRNDGPRGPITTTSHWEGQELVTTGQRTVSTPRGEVTIETREARALSEDGKTMTVTSTIETPRGTRTRKLVFARSS